MEVYKAISAVMLAIGKVGISKDRSAQSYKFRGVDDVLNALSPLLSLNGLIVLPRVISRESVERITQKGGAIFYVTILMEFDFVSAFDGSKHTVATYGEAMDSSDKATNKAMSAAFKYACFQAFCIPTEGDNDTENSAHEVVPAVVMIDGNQVAEIRRLLKACELDEIEWLQPTGYGIAEKIPASAYGKALKILKNLAGEK